jgi:hypothetical protein
MRPPPVFFILRAFVFYEYYLHMFRSTGPALKLPLRAYWLERRVLLLGGQLLEKLPHLALRVSTSGIAHFGDDR